MKKVITLLAIVIATLSVYSQNKYEHDLILTVDREQIWCDISELSDDMVKYHPVDMPEGIAVTKKIENIEYIVFRNGVKKDFNV